MIYFEKEICGFLGIPTIPKRKWNGKSSFKRGVAVVELTDGQAYAVATFDAETDEQPKIIKVFDLAQYKSIIDIFVVPEYMDTDVDSMDLDDDSKQSAKFLVEEANEKIDPKMVIDEPANEYYFDNIHNDEQAAAFIKAYNKSHKIKGRVPNSHEGLIMKLSVIYANENK